MSLSNSISDSFSYYFSSSSSSSSYYTGADSQWWVGIGEKKEARGGGGGYLFIFKQQGKGNKSFVSLILTFLYTWFQDEVVLSRTALKAVNPKIKGWWHFAFLFFFLFSFFFLGRGREDTR